MFENDYYTARNYEGNNNLNINDFDNNINNRRSNTQNYFFNNNNNYNDINEDEFNYENNNSNDDFVNNENFNDNENLFNMNQNDNQYNDGIVIFKNRINKLQKKVGKLNKYRNEIQEAISHNIDNNNNLNRTQNYLDNYENNYLDENEKQGLKFNKSFDVFKMNYNNYDFLFDSQNNNNEEEEEENNSSNNFMEKEGDQFDNEDTNMMINYLPNNDFDMNYNNQNDDNSFVGFYDNIFTSKNVNIDQNLQKIDKINNDMPINVNKNDYKNTQLYEQNYQFNIPKTINNNIIDENKKENKKNNNIQIVSNELSIIRNENKENSKNINTTNNNIDKNNLIIPQKNDIKNDDSSNEKNNEFKEEEDIHKKELEKYDSIIAQAKELNNQFQTEKNYNENKNNKLNDDVEVEVVNKKKFECNTPKENIEESNQIKINSDTNNIINFKKNEKKIKKIINKNKNVSFAEEKIYIKYNQDDYIVKISLYNNKKEKINFVPHDLKKYIHKLKKNEYLESAIINCQEIDYHSINNKMINFVKKESKVQSKNPKIDNKVNKSVKNPKVKIHMNKPEIKKEPKNNLKIDKIRKKPINNNIKIIKNNPILRKEKNIKSIPQYNLNKAKIMNKNKIENKQLKKNESNKNKDGKNVINNFNIFDNPQFIEGQRAINNLKKFFAEYSLEDDKNE